MLQKIIFVFFLLIFSSFSYAIERNEEILNFISDIAVNKDASIDVTEKITVYANQDLIKHGIIRWLPTTYIDAHGIKRHISYQVSKVLVDNVLSPYHIEKKPQQFAIYIGDKNKILTPGTYIYTIRYHVNNAINVLKDQDEIYWNVTGNQWTFPIVSTTAEVWTPGGAKVLKYAGYTGIEGAKDKNFSISLPASNEIVFHIKKPLQPGEDLTIAASWPKGFIQKPSVVKQLQNHLQTDQADSISLSIIFLLLFYYFIAWYFSKTSHQNTKYLIFGLILTVLAFAVVILSTSDKSQTFFAAFWLSVWTFGCYALLFKTVRMIKKAIQSMSFPTVINAFLMILLFLGFVATEIVGIILFSNIVSLITMSLLFIIIIINITFYSFNRRSYQETLL